jgi:Tol biopolymer transport system component
MSGGPFSALPNRRLVVLVAIGAAAVVGGLVVVGLDRAKPREWGGTERTRTSAAAGVTCATPSTRLSFVSFRQGGQEIHVLDLRRPHKVTRVTRLPWAVGDPAWSPDGRWLAFRWFRPRTESVGIYVAKADGSGVRLLADGGLTPDWSPDGRQIAYAGAGQGISVLDVKSALKGTDSASATLVEPTFQQEYPVWSPDGTRLLFAGHQGGSYDIWVVNADGTGLCNLTPAPSLEYGASWSPDRTEIVFGSDRDGGPQEGGDIYVIEADGTNLRRLTRGGGNWGPAWSPDGRWIAFNSTRHGNSEIYIMRPDGTDQRRLTFKRKFDGKVVWVGECSPRT